MNRTFSLVLVGAFTLVGCRRDPYGMEDMKPISGPRGGSATSQQDAAAMAARQTEETRAQIAQQANAANSEAMATCAPAICAAIGRHELTLGMSQSQVLAATTTTLPAWDVRGTATNGTMVSSTNGPRVMIQDRNGEVVLVTLRDGKTVAFTYRESSGLRSVSSPEDATTEGRRRATALNLLNQGDQQMATGDVDGALERYDQADVINPNDPAATLRIARILDKKNRYIEAVMRYQKFLHEMDIETINATGKANAELAGAIATARERVITLNKNINKK